jgi:hypothetical protein
MEQEDDTKNTVLFIYALSPCTYSLNRQNPIKIQKENITNESSSYFKLHPALSAFDPKGGLVIVFLRSHVKPAKVLLLLSRFDAVEPVRDENLISVLLLCLLVFFAVFRCCTSGMKPCGP